MVDQINTLHQLEDLFQVLTVTVTGLDPNKGVRISWPAGGSPDWAKTEDVIFVATTLRSEDITRQRYKLLASSDTPGILNREVQYTRVHLVQWIAYGPNSFENIDKIRDKLEEESTQETLAKSHLYPILETMQIVRQPELFNGEWWERTDLTWAFNEGVVKYGTIPYLESSSIHIVTENGEEQEVPR